MVSRSTHISNSYPTTAKHEIAKIDHALECTFIISWNSFLDDTQKKNDITLELKKILTTYFTESSAKKQPLMLT
jgi:hypothetical protein